jgi:hypothetical protein
MPKKDPNNNGQVDNAPHNRTHNDGKQWAQDLVLEEIGRNNPRLGARTKRWILAVGALVIIAGGVAVGVVLSQGGGNDDNGGNSTEAPRETDVSSAPSSAPSTRTSVSRVTEQPTEYPTLDPTLPPTGAPTASPVAATLVPTSFQTIPSVVNQFLSGLPLYSKELSSINPSSPQAKALDWLQRDPRYDEYFNVYRLNQRYALAVLYFSTNRDSWINRTGWLSNNNECEWHTDSDIDVCDEQFRLSTLHLFLNNLDGSIPTELELLIDLNYILFFDLALLGMIHSEL